MIRSSLCDYSDACILINRTITVLDMVVFKNSVPFTSCTTKINDTQEDYAEDIDIEMPMYNLIEYSNAYSKTSGSL